MTLKIGQEVWIRCKVQPGPFSEESLVTIDTIDGSVSGFVQEAELNVAPGKVLVRGLVRSIGNQYIEVWIRGSFFTTNGIANVDRKLAIAA